MQLNLFEWDLLAVGSGLDALSRLDFAEAHRCLNRVLEHFPSHPGATAAHQELLFWQQCIARLDSMARQDAAYELWLVLNEYSFSPAPPQQQLHRSLLRYLRHLLNDRPQFFQPPDLCLGSIALMAGDLEDAELRLRAIRAQRPDDGILSLLLAEALWRQGKTEPATIFYAQALLLEPGGIAERTISNQPLAAIINEYGTPLAPIYGYFAGILPLVPCRHRMESQTTVWYDLLRQIELARQAGRHQEMIASRRSLKQQAPEIFTDYLAWLEGRTAGDNHRP